MEESVRVCRNGGNQKQCNFSLHCLSSQPCRCEGGSPKQSPVKCDASAVGFIRLGGDCFVVAVLPEGRSDMTLCVSSISFAKCFELYNAGLVPNSPGDNLLCMFAVISFNDGPAAVSAIMAAPFEVMEITSGMDFLDDRIAVACIVGRFDKITVHKILSLFNNGQVLSNYTRCIRQFNL